MNSAVRLAAAKMTFAIARGLVKAELSVAGRRRAAEEQLAAAITAWLASLLPAVQEWAINQLPKEAVQKKDEPPPDLSAEGYVAEIEAALTSATGSGSEHAASALGVDFDTPPKAALQAAKDQAASLVGKKWVNGDLVDNPNSEYVISDALRDDVRELVAGAIEGGWSPHQLSAALEESFTDWRAETIARTETGFAYATGTAQVYKENEVAYVEILDGDGCLPDGHDDSAPEPDGTPGVVDQNAQANGQIWTLAEYDAHPLGHPNCVRGALPYFESNQEEPA